MVATANGVVMVSAVMATLFRHRKESMPKCLDGAAGSADAASPAGSQTYFFMLSFDMPSSFFIESLDMLSFDIVSFFIKSFDMLSLDIVSLLMVSVLPMLSLVWAK